MIERGTDFDLASRCMARALSVWLGPDMTTLRARALFTPAERVLHNLLSRRRICVETVITPPLFGLPQTG